MKSIIFILILLCSFCSNLSAQENIKIDGVARLNETIFIDKTEVTVQQWINFIINNGFNDEYFPDLSSLSRIPREFFTDLKNKKDFKYIKINGKKNNSANPLDNFTFEISNTYKSLIKKDSNSYFLETPIVGVTYKQAKAYCKWRETIINKNNAVQIKVTLPSTTIYDMQIDYLDSVNLKLCPLFNFKTCNCINLQKMKKTSFQGIQLLPADSYWPSNYGVFCIQGNASEMTETEGIAVGGSFRHPANESFIGKRQVYDKPTDWLGFRCLYTFSSSKLK
jgi:hypothetical protein